MIKDSKYAHITQLFDSWPERITVPVRLHLYTRCGTFRVSLRKLKRVFSIAHRFNVQVPISTNLNRINAVYVSLNNYVLRNRECKFSLTGSWGNHYGFLLELAREFPEDVFVDDPTDDASSRYRIDASGNITEIIQTWEAV